VAKKRKGQKNSCQRHDKSRDQAPAAGFASQLVSALSDSCLRNALSALAVGNGEGARQWIEQVPEGQRPKATVAAIHHQLAKVAAAQARWLDFEKELALAIKEDPLPIYQQRLALARRRGQFLEESKWRTLSDNVDPARRLASAALAPAVSGVWSCGAYYSRGAMSGRPWSRLLRAAKRSAEVDEDRDAVVGLAAGFFCRFMFDKTPLLSLVDAVVAIPANPARYNARRMSLPDELARAVEAQLAVPFVFTALTYTAGANLDLRGLSRPERFIAVKGSMGAGDLGVAAGRKVLVVDDVVTSGATLTEAARLLREAGAADVYALTMCHTEG
jgi:predicted amidophosphoribosyltransferase